MIPIDKSIHCLVGSKNSMKFFQNRNLIPRFDWVSGSDVVHEIDRNMKFYPECSKGLILASNFDNTYPLEIVGIMQELRALCEGKQTVLIHSYNPVTIGQFTDPTKVWVENGDRIVTIDNLIDKDLLDGYSIGYLYMSDSTLENINYAPFDVEVYKEFMKNCPDK
jgi:hypothetical protein